MLGWRDVPVEPSCAGPTALAGMPVIRQLFVGAFGLDGDQLERRLYVLRRVIERRSDAVGLTRDRFHLASLSSRTLVYKGMLTAEQLPVFYPDLRDARDGLAAGHGPRPLLHQRPAALGPGPALPPQRPQRRDQHPARQRQLDAGPAVEVPQPPLRRRHQQAPPGDRRAGLGLEPVRQRARAADHGRPLGRARDHDDDPRGLGPEPAHGRGAARLLRVPRLAPRALGRPGGDRLHRRPADRRHPRPQRAAPGPLAGHRRRPGGDGLRGRGAAHRRGADHQEVAAGAGPPAPRRHRGRRDPRRRRGQERAEPAPPLPAVDPPGRGPARRAAAGRRAARPRPRHPAGPPPRLRLHRGGAQAPARPDGPRRRGAGGLDGQRRPPGGAQRASRQPLRLLQAALRPGHQPAHRPDPRGAGDVPGDQPRGRGQPARAGAGPGQAAGGAHPDPEQRRPRDHPPRDPAPVPGGHHLDHLPLRRRGGGPRGGPGADLPAGLREDPRGLHGAGPLRPPRRRQPRPHPRPAGHRRGPPPPGPGAHPERGRVGGRDRRGPRGDARRPADRLRRRDGEPLPRPGDDRRAAPPGAAAGGDRPRPGQGALHPRPLQGGAQGHLEDGHLHHRVLRGSPDLRGGGARPRAGQPLLPGHGVADRRGRTSRWSPRRP